MDEENRLLKVLGEKEHNLKLRQNEQEIADEQFEYSLDSSEVFSTPLQTNYGAPIRKRTYQLKLLIQVAKVGDELLIGFGKSSKSMAFSEVQDISLEFSFDGAKEVTLNNEINGKVEVLGFTIEKV